MCQPFTSATLTPIIHRISNIALYSTNQLRNSISITRSHNVTYVSYQVLSFILFFIHLIPVFCHMFNSSKCTLIQYFMASNFWKTVCGCLMQLTLRSNHNAVEAPAACGLRSQRSRTAASIRRPAAASSKRFSERFSSSKKCPPLQVPRSFLRHKDEI